MKRFTGRTWLISRVHEWLMQSEDQIFLVTGEPGSGKSAFIEWLSGTGQLPASAQARSELEHIRSLVKAAHFCVAASGNVAPKAFAQHVADQLLRHVPGFDAALTASLEDRVRISVRQEVGKVESEAQVTGLHVAYLDLGALGEEYSVNLVFREPLIKLYKDGYDEPMLVLVDALDEAATYTGQVRLDELLSRLKDLPPQVRLLLTTRPDPRIIKYYPNCPRADLIEDSPGDADDVRHEVFERLHQFDGARRNIMTERISEAAEGNFLYAHLVVDDFLAQKDKGEDMVNLPLPTKLSGLYHTFINRELARDEGRWFETFEPLLGLIAVSFGAGLTASQLESIVGRRVTPELRACKQYLEGELPEGPFSMFHKSFSDFLLRDEKNVDYHVNAGEMHRRIVDYYRGTAAGAWGKMDEYGWRYLTAHALDAEGEPDFRLLFEICDSGFLVAKYNSVRGVAALEDDWARVFQACRKADDFLRLVQYGVERARQFTSVMYLQSTQLARVAARLAVEDGSEAKVARLVEEINLVAHPRARLGAKLAMLHVLTARMPAHPAVEELHDDIEAAIDASVFDEGDSHYVAEYLKAVAGLRREGWLTVCTSRLPEVKGLAARASVWAAIARASAKEGNVSEAAWALRGALIECGRLNLAEDFTKSMVGMVLGIQDQFQTQMLGQALKIVLEAAPVLDPSGCEEIVLMSKQLFEQMGNNLFAMGEEENLERLRLENLAVEALAGAGLRQAAEGIAQEVLASNLADQNSSAAIFALLPLVKKFGGDDDSARWQRKASDVTDELVSQNPLRLAFLIKDISTQSFMAGVLPEMLELICARAGAQSPDSLTQEVRLLLAYASALLGRQAHARALHMQTLDEFSAEGVNVRAPDYALLLMWDTVCAIREEDLLGETLDRLIPLASLTLNRDRRVSLWMQACESLDAVAELSVRRAVFDRLQRVATEVVDAQAYLATALLQFADAYNTLGVHDEAARLLTESLRLQNAVMTGEDLINSLTETARQYLLIGDQQTCADLLGQALDATADIDDEPGSEYSTVSCLQTIMPLVGELARLEGRVREMTVPLLKRVLRIVEGLQTAETAIGAASTVVRETRGSGFAEPVAQLNAILQREDAFLNLNYRPPSAIPALMFLHEAGGEEEVRKLLPRAEKELTEKASGFSDHEKSFACDGFAEMVRVYETLALPEKVEHWYGETRRLAQSIKEPLYRCEGFLNVTAVAARLGRVDEAGESLVKAIFEWRQVASSRAGMMRVPGIMSAWHEIAGGDARYKLVTSLQRVLGRLPDLDEREHWQAYIAATFLDHPDRLAELAAPLTGQPGLGALQMSMRGSQAGEPEVVRRATFEVLEKSSRLTLGVFAGHSLGAAQTLIRRGVLPRPAALPVLKSLEATIRSLSAV